jgi:hypothetical protein
MHLIARAATTLVTTALVVGGTAAAANAQATTIRDKVSDVVTYSDTNQNGTVLGYTDSVATGADIRSLKVKHSTKSVTIALAFAELGPDTSMSAVFRLNGKKQPSLGLVSTGKRSADVFNLKGKKVCSAKLTTTTGTKGSIKAVVKRSCLKNPKKIKVGADATAFTQSGDTFTVHQDVVSTSSVRSFGYTKWLKAS